jgi:6,7-dimethyl-8-ribityllumazine synthase
VANGPAASRWSRRGSTRRSPRSSPTTPSALSSRAASLPAELPQAALALARTGRYAGIVCVGVVIRGETPHFEFVAGVAAHGLSRVALTTGVPVTFGVITSLTEAQAWERAGGGVGHRGEEAARAALEMAAWKRDLRAQRPKRRAPRGTA